ncbi:MAG: hypothetical protein ABSF84_13815 [Acidimicrobiales bacterium]|jgi:hypothetical protein
MTVEADGTQGLPADCPTLTDEELCELALSAEPGLPPADDAVPLSVYLGQVAGLLPAWYMPTPTSRARSRWRLPVVLVLVAAFVIIEAFGLCSTFGQVVPA